MFRPINPLMHPEYCMLAKVAGRLHVNHQSFERDLPSQSTMHLSPGLCWRNAGIIS